MKPEDIELIECWIADSRAITESWLRIPEKYRNKDYSKTPEGQAHETVVEKWLNTNEELSQAFKKEAVTPQSKQLREAVKCKIS